MMSEPVKIIPNEQNADAIAILPGQYVSFFNITLPDLPEDKILRILPGIMADKIVGDINVMHLSLVQKMENGNYIVSVCEHKWLEHAKRTVLEKNKVIKAIWPDYALLDVPDKDINIMKLSGRVLARYADGTGFNVEERFFDHIIGPLQYKEVFECRSVPKGVGLASGKFSAKPPVITYMRSLIRAGILGAVIFVLWAISGMMMISEMENEWERYQNASVEIFKKTYPDATRIVNVEAQMKARAIENGDSSGADFINSANLVFRSVNGSPGVTLESLSFNSTDTGTRLDLTISTNSFAQASYFESQLVSAGFDVTQGESSQTSENIFNSYELQESLVE